MAAGAVIDRARGAPVARRKCNKVLPTDRVCSIFVLMSSTTKNKAECRRRLRARLRSPDRQASLARTGDGAVGPLRLQSPVTPEPPLFFAHFSARTTAKHPPSTVNRELKDGRTRVILNMHPTADAEGGPKPGAACALRPPNRPENLAQGIENADSAPGNPRTPEALSGEGSVARSMIAPGPVSDPALQRQASRSAATR